MQQKRGSLYLFVIVIAVASTPFHTSNAQATNCKCRQHAAEAEAAGTCSRTEDKKSCTLTFTTTTPAEYQAFVARLRGLGLNRDPREVLGLAFQRRPDELKDIFTTEILPILFAISQRTTFADATPAIIQELKESESKIKDVITNPAYEKRAVEIGLRNFRGVASFGCLEIRRDNFYSMVKTRWTAATFFCDDFPK